MRPGRRQPGERRHVVILRRAGLVLLVISVLATVGAVWAAGTPTILRYTMAGGGGTASAGSFTIRSTIGQAITGHGTTGNTEICSGFWCAGIRYKIFLPLVLR